MIVLDIETSGINPLIHGLWQIGALEFENPSNTFLQEGRIDDEDEVHKSALKIIGRTEAQLRDPKKMSQRELVGNFFSWARNVRARNAVGQNLKFDLGFIETKSTKYGLHDPRELAKLPLPYRSFDIHSIAQTLYYRVNGKFLWDERNNVSYMGLFKILEFCGIPDERTQTHLGKIVKEGSPHNALEDAKLTAECFSRLVYGRNLLPEFSKYPIPAYLTHLIGRNEGTK